MIGREPSLPVPMGWPEGGVMDRQAWLNAQLASAEASYEQGAGEEGPITGTHRRFVQTVIDSCPAGGAVLDAPCGTGRYFDLVLAAGRTVVGMDQSGGALARARNRSAGVELEKARLQELALEREFDAAMCIDAMEFVCPEDWPVVLGNLRRAVRRGGLLYLTVEQIDQAEIESAYADARAEGLPVIYGETRRGGGYHHYPPTERIFKWVAAEGLEVVDEAVTRARNYGYLHLLLRER
jgi:cyclopropane fatty-acyl-phospholipid synthase-like methyltransferase